MHKIKNVLADRSTVVKGSLAVGAVAVLGLAGTVGVHAATGGGYGNGYGTVAPTATPIYRTVNPRNGDHFYTADLAEKNNAVSSYHYNDEGTAFTAFTALQSGNKAGVQPVYRLVSTRTGDHFYTDDFTEAMNASSLGYVNEGIAFSAWQSASDAANGDYVVAVDRLLKNSNGDHFYTVSAAESASAVTNFGYHEEGTAFYVQN